MNVNIITRCYKTTNIQKIKDNIRGVFASKKEHSYVHYLLVDMSYNQPQQSFKCFEDEHTKVVFIYDKKDYYNTWGIDQIVQSIPADQNGWVYILDDDNIINNNFTSIFDSYQGEDILLVDSNAYKYTSPPIIGKVIGYIDISNYVIKLDVFKNNNIYVEGHRSYTSDGAFFESLLKKQYKIKCTKQNAVTKSALRRPLNVLRQDL